MQQTPKKLIKDSIVDAVCELRFDCKEKREAPELVVGFLAGNPAWKGFERKRLPAADIPEQIRIADPNFQNQATLELLNVGQSQRIRLGAGTAATARFNSYPGWDTMRDDIAALSTHAFQALEDFEVTRVGIRYTNVLVPEDHLINSVHDFRFKVSVDEKPLGGGINLNFIQLDDSTTHTVRIASPEFIANIRPKDGVAVVDIDSSTIEPQKLSSPEKITEWANMAHNQEKQIFFSLFEEETLGKIVEEWN